MNIGKASKLSELTIKTVRYYANIDLVKPKQSSLTGYREYSEEDVLKLKFIGKARKFNFSINECRELLSLYENQNRPSKEVKKLMNIGKASKLSDLTVKTVRYYANIELVKPKQSNFTGYREYSEEDVLKLKFVGKARKFNFSIEECRELLSLYENENRSSKEVKKITLEKICEIDKKLKELKDLRNELSYLANNCHGDDRPNCPILDAFSQK